MLDIIHCKFINFRNVIFNIYYFFPTRLRDKNARRACTLHAAAIVIVCCRVRLGGGFRGCHVTTSY